MNKIEKTKELYGFLWGKDNSGPVKEWHSTRMQEVIPEPIVRGSLGVEIGSGCGYDTYIMARDNPLVKIISLDMGEGAYKTKMLTAALKNVRVIKGSATDLPLRDNAFDFAYSYGVLHHTFKPDHSLREVARIIKKGAPAYVYLYEDHADNYLKYAAVGIVRVIRTVSTRMPLRMLYLLSLLLSPLVFIFFTFPAKILRKTGVASELAGKIPFNHGTHPFSLAGDLLDRLGAPIEHRFSREEVFDIFTKCGFTKISITKLRDTAGWVAWGYKE